MYKAFDLKGYDKSFIEAKHQSFFIQQGRTATAAGQAAVQEALKAIATDKAVLDGQAIRDAWFPQVQADVFLSHSHRNEEDVLMFAGWLDYTFGLKAFIDSS